MTFEPLLDSDLNYLESLQPPDWNPIIPSQKEFIKLNFCFPFKLTEKGVILAIGTYVKFGTSVWLAQIIVHPLMRSRGIGYMITKALLQCPEVMNATSINLIATELGLPLYQKCGFQRDSTYLFYRGGDILVQNNALKPISVEAVHYDEILVLDQKIYGENRSAMIAMHLDQAKIVVDKNKVTGFYLPTLKEGLIVADSIDSGFKLMQYKSETTDVFVVPEENKAAIHLLENSGFKNWRRGIRMWKGEKIKWQPENIYSRVSGGFG